jgi:hypothetical protein
MVATSLLAAGDAEVVLLRRWSGLHCAPTPRPRMLVATTLDLDDCSLKVHGPS